VAQDSSKALVVFHFRRELPKKIQWPGRAMEVDFLLAARPVTAYSASER
jgi:hypothetical protein